MSLDHTVRKPAFMIVLLVLDSQNNEGFNTLTYFDNNLKKEAIAGTLFQDGKTGMLMGVFNGAFQATSGGPDWEINATVVSDR
jgi:hypothetical protein